MSVEMFAAVLLALAYVPARHYARRYAGLSGSLLQRCARLRAIS